MSEFCLDLSETTQTKRLPVSPCSFEFNELPKANPHLPQGQRYPAWVAGGKWYDANGVEHVATFALSGNLATMINRVKGAETKLLNKRLKLENNKITAA